MSSKKALLSTVSMCVNLPDAVGVVIGESLNDTVWIQLADSSKRLQISRAETEPVLDVARQLEIYSRAAQYYPLGDLISKRAVDYLVGDDALRLDALSHLCRIAVIRSRDKYRYTPADGTHLMAEGKALMMNSLGDTTRSWGELSHGVDEAVMHVSTYLAPFFGCSEREAYDAAAAKRFAFVISRFVDRRKSNHRDEANRRKLATFVRPDGSVNEVTINRAEGIYEESGCRWDKISFEADKRKPKKIPEGDFWLDIRAALSSLSPEVQRTCIAAWRDEVPLAKIATAEGVSESAIKLRLKRAKAKLAQNVGLAAYRRQLGAM